MHARESNYMLIHKVQHHLILHFSYILKCKDCMHDYLHDYMHLNQLHAPLHQALHYMQLYMPNT